LKIEGICKNLNELLYTDRLELARMQKYKTWEEDREAATDTMFETEKIFQ
jgi:hypothetical protein